MNSERRGPELRGRRTRVHITGPGPVTIHSINLIDRTDFLDSDTPFSIHTHLSSAQHVQGPIFEG